MKGGKVLGSGTYGCILKPPLPCQGSSERPPNMVSKLMLEYNAIDEMQQVTTISILTQKIPEHDQYYILNQIRICQPAKLTADDLVDFKKKCTAMTSKQIDEKTINNAIEQKKIAVLQLPDGGFDITHYFSKGNPTEATFSKINEALLKLLVGGIAPLYKVGVLHQDIKGPNIVYSKSNGLARLIDWGLATTIKGTSIPKNVRGWPIMYNASFGILALHKTIQRTFNSIMLTSKMRAEVAKYKHSNLIEKMHPLVKNTLKRIIFENDKSVIRHVGSLGHIYYLESVLKKVVQLSPPSLNTEFAAAINKSSFNALTNIISDHLAKIFLTFSVKPNNTIGEFRESEFFNSVYKHNCDIIGFISVYYDLITNTQTDAERRYKAFNIVKKFQFSPRFATEAIDIQDVVSTISHDYLPSTQLKIEIVPPAPVTTVTSRPVAPVLVQEKRSLPGDNFTWSLRRRCPKGYRRNKKTQKCTKNSGKPNPKTKRRRCPNGTRINKKTGNCDPK